MTIPASAPQTAIGPQQDIFLSVVIPAYNEASRIGSTVLRVASYLQERLRRWELLVVDDGSSDNTGMIVNGLISHDKRVRVITNSPNRGKGYAVRTGMLAAAGDWILFSDADLSAPIEEVEKLLGAASGGYHVAIGSRALRRELIEVRQSPIRETAGQAFNFALRCITGLTFRDTQCGFKLFQREAARRLFTKQQIWSFGFDPEVLFLARKYGFKSIEVPVRWAHSEGSKINVLSDGTKMLLDLLRVRLNDLAGKYNESE